VKAFILKNDLGIVDLTTNQFEEAESAEIAEISDMMNGIDGYRFIKHSHLLNEN